MVIQFTAKGTGLKKRMTRKVRGITDGIAFILGVDRSTIEIDKAQNLGAGGFRFSIEVDVNVDDNVDVEQLMQKAIDGGALAEMYRDCWTLQKVPVFIDLECKMMNTTSEMQIVDKVQSEIQLQAGNPSTAAHVANSNSISM